VAPSFTASSSKRLASSPRTREVGAQTAYPCPSLREPHSTVPADTPEEPTPVRPGRGGPGALLNPLRVQLTCLWPRLLVQEYCETRCSSGLRPRAAATDCWVVAAWVRCRTCRRHNSVSRPRARWVWPWAPVESPRHRAVVRQAGGNPDCGSDRVLPSAPAQVCGACLSLEPVRLRGDSGGGVGVPAVEWLFALCGFLPLLPGRGCVLKPFVGLLGRGGGRLLSWCRL
jgi:hypothetical protein